MASSRSGHHATLHESVLKAECKLVEEHRSIRVMRPEELQPSPMELDGFIKVRHDATLSESGELKLQDWHTEDVQV